MDDSDRCHGVVAAGRLDIHEVADQERDLSRAPAPPLSDGDDVGVSIDALGGEGSRGDGAH